MKKNHGGDDSLFICALPPRSGQTGTETPGHPSGGWVLDTELQLALPKQGGCAENPSSRSCCTSTPTLGQEGEGWVLHYCCGTLRRPLVAARASGTSVGSRFSAQSVNTSAHTDVTVCVRGARVGWGEGVENLGLPVTSPLAPGCLHPPARTLAAPRDDERPHWPAGNWLHIAPCKYVIWGAGWGGRGRNIN